MIVWFAMAGRRTLGLTGLSSHVGNILALAATLFQLKLILLSRLSIKDDTIY